MAHPSLTQVNSSSIEAWGWIENEPSIAPGRLFVQFKNQKIYEYIVPSSVALKLKTASSKGTYVNELKKIYKGNQVDEDYVVSAFRSIKRVIKPKLNPIILGGHDKLVFAHFF
jgi:hypothetical protein